MILVQREKNWLSDWLSSFDLYSENSALLSLFCPQSFLHWSVLSLPFRSHFPPQHHTLLKLIKLIHTFIFLCCCSSSFQVQNTLSYACSFLFIKNLTHLYFHILVSVTLLMKNFLIAPFRFPLKFITISVVVLQQSLAQILRTYFIPTWRLVYCLPKPCAALVVNRFAYVCTTQWLP